MIEIVKDPKFVKVTNLSFSKASCCNLPSHILEEILSHPADKWSELTYLAISERFSLMKIEEVSRCIWKKKRASTRKAVGKLIAAKSALRGIRSCMNAISRVGNKEKAGIFDEFADEILVRDNANRFCL